MGYEAKTVASKVALEKVISKRLKFEISPMTWLFHLSNLEISEQELIEQA
jgi:hypothetical protein